MHLVEPKTCSDDADPDAQHHLPAALPCSQRSNPLNFALSPTLLMTDMQSVPLASQGRVNTRVEILSRSSQDYLLVVKKEYRNQKEMESIGFFKVI